MRTVDITYVSDVLCLWAYIAQARVDATHRTFGDQVRIEYRFCSVFGDTATKIGTGWKDRGGFAGFGAHAREAAERFDHVSVHPDIWLDVRPASSASPHLFLRAVQATHDRQTFETLLWDFRCAFFHDARDIGSLAVQRDLAARRAIDLAAVDALVDSGEAFARLMADYDAAEKMRIEGSPSFVLNDGRQKLYGNVGFRIIEANIQELLREPSPEVASWC
ncbi:MAG TPA: DsbA family protein [Caulobacteraceae bacterium]|nr:DsbA family protein [Caulobacteraceae bacterium]